MSNEKPKTRAATRKPNGKLTETPITTEAGTEKRIEHTRGLRKSVSRVFYNQNGDLDSSRTINQAAADNESIFDKYKSLYDAANSLLRSSGELDHAGALDMLKTVDFGESKIDKSFFSLLLWHSQISERHGAVSQEAIAANFLLLADGVCRLTSNNEKHMSAVFGFARSWHDWQSEVAGEHSAAAQAAVAAKNLLKAGPKRTAKRDARVKIVRELVIGFWQQRPNYKSNSQGTASHILEIANEKLESMDLGQYTLGTLIKIVGEISDEAKRPATS